MLQKIQKNIIAYAAMLAGKFYAWQETQRFIKASADPNHINPPAQEDNSNGTLSNVWAFSVINGASKVGHFPQFHACSIEANQGIQIFQHYDEDFERESLERKYPADERYNNVALVGFQGYQPTPKEDVIFQVCASVSPNFYGTAGFVIQPINTLDKDALFKGRFNNGGFSYIGLSMMGPESFVFGTTKVTLQQVIRWWPTKIEPHNTNMYEKHTYQFRLHWVNAKKWLAIISIDGKVVSQMTLPPFGPLEVDIWDDNHLVDTSDPDTYMGVYQTHKETKWSRYENIRVWTEPVTA